MIGRKTKYGMGILIICLYVLLAGTVVLAGKHDTEKKEDSNYKMEQLNSTSEPEEDVKAMKYTRHTKVWDVINDPVFEDYGRLIFPVDIQIDRNLELEDVEEILPWYSEVNPDKTVEIANYMRNQAVSGEQIFYDIYTEEEKAADPEKEDTGLFFFRGNPNEKFAVLNAGGGFMYVAGMQDSFPHALELSQKGYNAFALIYRPGAQTACENLSRAIAFILDHADELQIDPEDYSLWGGSAGARMAAWEQVMVSHPTRPCPGGSTG